MKMMKMSCEGRTTVAIKNRIFLCSSPFVITSFHSQDSDYQASSRCGPALASTTAIYPLCAGGAASVVWCWLIGGGGALAVALSIAENISSSYPTSGEQRTPLRKA